MYFILFGLMIVSVIVIQTTFVYTLSIYGIYPDLILILTIYFAFKSEENKGVIIGASLGLLQDILSSGLLGLNFFTKGLIAFLIKDIRNNIAIDYPVSQITIIFSSAFLEGILTLIILKIFFPNEYVFQIFSGVILYRAVYCSLIGIPLLALLKKVELVKIKEG